LRVAYREINDKTLRQAPIEDEDRCRRLGAAGLAYARANFEKSTRSQHGSK
jgi:hypothetical protein